MFAGTAAGSTRSPTSDAPRRGYFAMNVPLARYMVAFNPNIPWWQRFAYLYPIPYLEQREWQDSFVKALRGEDKAFNTLVETSVKAYVEHHTEPPAAIRGPILNIAEDVMAGRQVTIRAGDYITLQTYLKGNKAG